MAQYYRALDRTSRRAIELEKLADGDRQRCARCCSQWSPALLACLKSSCSGTYQGDDVRGEDVLDNGEHVISVPQSSWDAIGSALYRYASERSKDDLSAPVILTLEIIPNVAEDS